MKFEASWYALTVLKIALWTQLIWCLLAISTHHSDTVKRETYEAAQDVSGASAENLRERHMRQLADAINPMQGTRYMLLFTAAALAVLHSLDLIRHRLDAILISRPASSAPAVPVVPESPEANAWDFFAPAQVPLAVPATRAIRRP